MIAWLIDHILHVDESIEVMVANMEKSEAAE